MLPGRLYFKIFLSFIGVIVIAMFMVAMLFRFTEGEKFMNRFKRFANAQVVMVRMMVESNAKADPEFGPSMKGLMDELGEAYMAKLWITDGSGMVLVKSFPGPLPSPSDLEPEEIDVHGWDEVEGYEVSKCDNDPHCIYVVIPFGGTQGVKPGTIHYFYEDSARGAHEKRFVFGLLAICFSVAILIMPVSWFITRRLNRLRRVALRIADGDLSHRADICGKDEVAKVGRALNDMADSLSRMIRGSKELTANVSHELRTPLTRIRIAEEMLRQRCGEDGAAHLDSIREDVDALDKLIGRLLDLSKLDLNEAPFTLESVDMAEMAESIVDRLRPIADHRNITMTVELPNEAMVMADGEALYTALGNVLENGVKHADPGGWLKIFMERSESGGFMLFTENAHAPLPDDELTAIFEPFRRAKGTVPDGTGLGLAIAKKIIERHDGEMTAENCDGGVRFVVELPTA